MMKHAMHRRWLIVAFLAAWPTAAATLERLTTDELISRSTTIVRARVTSSHTAQHGPLVYTHFSIQVIECLKGQTPTPAEVVLPGGSFGALRQTFAGVPKLDPDTEYLLFLWKSPNGLNHIIGLTQGVFSVTKQADGELAAWRPAASESMLEARTGRLVPDRPVTIRLSELRRRVAALGPRGGVTE